MKFWSPAIDNSATGIVAGPPTRRLRLAPRRAKRTLKLLSLLSGDSLAIWATRASVWFGRPRLKVTYSRDTNLYFVHESEVHAFSHPKRLWTLFNGQIARGKKLAYEYLLDQIDFQDGDRIIDVGANTGDLALAFRAMNRKVYIEAFEPSPGEFAALQKNLAACSAVINFHAHQVALWSEVSDGLTFYLKPGKGDSSILPIEGAAGKIMVEGQRLDNTLSPDGTRYRLLKLEAEGAEPEILQGTERLLPQIDFITVDVGFERGTKALSTLPEVVNFLLTRGFEVVGFEGGRYVLLFENKSIDRPRRRHS